MSKFRFHRHIRRIEYEDLQQIYFQCSKFGHRKEGCPELKLTHKPDEVLINDAQSVEMMEYLDDIFPAKVLEPSDSWMVAKRSGRRYPRKSLVGFIWVKEGGGKLTNKNHMN